MEAWSTLFNTKNVRIINNADTYLLPHQSFATDDALIEKIDPDTAVVRVWRHRPCVILGIADTRLPYLKEAVRDLTAQHYDVVVRNSGGLAVVKDEGVLSVSLILPGEKTISIDEGYRKMVAFVCALLQPYTQSIKAYEIKGSYCPGDFDLSIDGKKFAGISQRRVKNGLAVQIYLAITPDDHGRANLIKRFYDIGKQNEETTFTYPNIQPETMASLSTLVGKSLTVNTIIGHLKTLLTHHFQVKETSLTEAEYTVFKKREQQMIDRNIKALGELFYLSN